MPSPTSLTQRLNMPLTQNRPLVLQEAQCYIIVGRATNCMRPIGWLHISDFHLRANHAWSQDAVLSAMRDDIVRRRKAGAILDFILATGDLAFAGKALEYKLVVAFFDELATATGVPRERIFCIPGNHDIDRDRQKMSFAGARLTLQSENDVYSFLASGDDLETLIWRQENYRKFQETYFAGQERRHTADGLGYVSLVDLDDIRIAIVGLDSAWLAEGGLSDHGKLLLGEQQVIDALRTARAAAPLTKRLSPLFAKTPRTLSMLSASRPVGTISIRVTAGTASKLQSTTRT
jgi:hypothetical protein